MIHLVVALAGGAGAVVRVLVEGRLRHRAPGAHLWPLLAVNASGSLLLGLLAGAGAVGADARLALGTGFCGGYTTFSAASVATAGALTAGVRPAAVAAARMLLVCVAAAALGWAIAGSV